MSFYTLRPDKAQSKSDRLGKANKHSMEFKSSFNFLPWQCQSYFSFVFPTPSVIWKNRFSIRAYKMAPRSRQMCIVSLLINNHNDDMDTKLAIRKFQKKKVKQQTCGLFGWVAKLRRMIQVKGGGVLFEHRRHRGVGPAYGELLWCHWPWLGVSQRPVLSGAKSLSFACPTPSKVFYTAQNSRLKYRKLLIK